MFIIKGYIFHHREDESIVKMNLSDIMKEPLKVNNYEEGYECFEGVPYYMFLLSPIKEKVKEE